MKYFHFDEVQNNTKETVSFGNTLLKFSSLAWVHKILMRIVNMGYLSYFTFDLAKSTDSFFILR
jgi:hypothetical protein